MALYKITFTPSGSYFFGNEKTFAYDGKPNEIYYISSENTPLQSTLFGALRFMLLPEKGFDKLGKTINTDAIGHESFNIESTNQNFGTIKKMSAIFICKGDELFIPTPLDHNVAAQKEEQKLKGENATVYYTPMKEYKDDMSVLGGSSQTLYLQDYDAKCGLTSSYMSVDDRHLETDLFKSDIRIGINRKNTKDGFFKKEYKSLKPGFSFCVFAEIDNACLENKSHIVSLGQGKVPFAVTFKKSANSMYDVYNKIKESICDVRNTRKAIYCLSDVLVSDNLYEGMALSIVVTRDYRSFRTTSDKKFNKSGTLHRLVKAGSIFIPASNTDDDRFTKDGRQKNAEKIGLNTTIVLEVK